MFFTALDHQDSSSSCYGRCSGIAAALAITQHPNKDARDQPRSQLMRGVTAQVAPVWFGFLWLSVAVDTVAFRT